MPSDEGGSRAKRHHYVPKFYLNGFADQKGRLRTYRRVDGRHIRAVSTGKVAVEIGFYDVVNEDGETIDAAEIILSDIEAELAPALASLRTTWPPSDHVRDRVANFAALQAVRTRKERHAFQSMTAAFGDMLKGLMGDAGGMYMGDEFVSEDEVESLFAVDANDTVEMMFELASSLVEPLSRRSWALFRSKRRDIVTTDTPVTLVNMHPDPTVAMGYLTADAIVLPIDSLHVLYMMEPHRADAPNVLTLSRAMARNVSGFLVQNAYEYAFSDPRSDVLDRIELPVGVAPFGVISGPGLDGPRTIWPPSREAEGDCP